MKKVAYLKWILIGILLVLLHSFLRSNADFRSLCSAFFAKMLPVTYGLLFALFLEPIVDFLVRKCHMKRYMSIFITSLAFTVLVIIFICVVVPELFESFKDLYIKLPTMYEQVVKYLNRFADYLQSKGIDFTIDTDIRNTIYEYIRNNIDKIQKFGLAAAGGIWWWIMAITNIFIGFFLGILLLVDKKYFIDLTKSTLVLLFKKEKGLLVYDFCEESRKLLLSYINGRLVVSFVVGLITFFVLIACDVPYALLSSLLVGIGNMIPYLGSIAAGGISIFLIILIDPVKVIYLLIAISFAQFVDGWIIGPKLVGDNVGLNVFWVTTAIILGGSFFGILGMFFGVPIACVVRLIYKHMQEQAQKNNEINENNIEI